MPQGNACLCQAHKKAKCEQILTKSRSADIMESVNRPNLFVTFIYNKEGNEASIRQVCESTLPTYWVPKAYIAVDELPMTGTGKPDRATARRMANNE